MASINQQKQLQFFFEKWCDECFVCEGPKDQVKYDKQAVRGDFDFVKKEALEYVEERIKEYKRLRKHLEQQNIDMYLK